MSEHPNAAVIRSAYEAISKADMHAVAELLADDITWYESTAGMEGVYRGRDQVLAFLGQVFQQAGMQMSVAIHDILANDDHAVILHESTLTVGTAPTPASTARLGSCSATPPSWWAPSKAPGRHRRPNGTPGRDARRRAGTRDPRPGRHVRAERAPRPRRRMGSTLRQPRPSQRLQQRHPYR
jgi:ketosteroid isomerase-like protein